MKYLVTTVLVVSCALGVHSVNASNTSCQFIESDPDSDGWGWENSESCIVTENTTEQYPVNPPTFPVNGNSHPVCTSSAADPDGDGWGWEFEQSCIVENSVITNPPETPVDERLRPLCSSASFDPDGDGWGWENHQSCVVLPVSTILLPTETPMISAPSPIDMSNPAVTRRTIGGCYDADVNIQIDNFMGIESMIVDSFLFFESASVNCAHAAATKLYLYKWEEENQLWSSCYESDWTTVRNSKNTEGDGFLEIFEPSFPACGTGYYVNYSTFCSQQVEEGAWACSDLTTQAEFYEESTLFLVHRTASRLDRMIAFATTSVER